MHIYCKYADTVLLKDIRKALTKFSAFFLRANTLLPRLDCPLSSTPSQIVQPFMSEQRNSSPSRLVRLYERWQMNRLK